MNKAMLVGCGESGRNDIENMANFLIKQCGFKPEEVHKIAEQKQLGTKTSGRLRKSTMR